MTHDGDSDRSVASTKPSVAPALSTTSWFPIGPTTRRPVKAPPINSAPVAGCTASVAASRLVFPHALKTQMGTVDADLPQEHVLGSCAAGRPCCRPGTSSIRFEGTCGDTTTGLDDKVTERVGVDGPAASGQ
ncbi:MAG: hypothetical protein R2699_09470 [Acidimicrobiales bacterium]